MIAFHASDDWQPAPQPGRHDLDALRGLMEDMPPAPAERLKRWLDWSEGHLAPDARHELRIRLDVDLATHLGAEAARNRTTPEVQALHDLQAKYMRDQPRTPREPTEDRIRTAFDAAVEWTVAQFRLHPEEWSETMVRDLERWAGGEIPACLCLADGCRAMRREG